jgi:hypothetical protein
MSMPGHDPRVTTRPTWTWAIVAAASVLGFFHVLHEVTSHSLAIIGSGLGGIAVGALGYGLAVAGATRGGIALAAGIGGGTGLVLLHLLPLLH